MGGAMSSYPLLGPPEIVSGFALPLASVSDLRDFWDVHELLEKHAVSLAQALELYRDKYPVEDIGHVVRSLVYFADAELEPMPSGLSSEKWSNIRDYFRERARQLD